MINAKGFYNETKNRALIEMMICLIGQAILVGRFGIVGVLMGTIIAYLYRTLDVIIYSNNKIIGQNPKKTFIRIIVNIIFMCMIAFVFKTDIKTGNYFSWIIYAVITAVISFIAISIINVIFDVESAKESKEYIINLLKIKNEKE